MDYRKSINSTAELAQWYTDKYISMGGTWDTPAAECNRHLDDLGVPYDNQLTLLDVGCGGGHFLTEAEKRVRCMGIEISAYAIGHAMRRTRHALFQHATIEAPDTYRPVTGFDFIVSIGSLEHIVNLHAALDNIRLLLAATGKWYFYCPNELWKHEDQPNERTMTDLEWMDLFRAHGLITMNAKRWNDSTAFWGTQT